MKRKTITIREDQWRFAADLGINVSAFTRRELDAVMKNGETSDLPDDECRRHKGSRKRTTITIERAQDEFIKNEEVNIAQFVQDRLQELMDCRLEQQHQETGQTPIGGQRLSRMIDESLTGGLSVDY